MFSSFGGLASHVVISFSLLASLFRTLYLDQAFFSCTLFGSRTLGMAMSDLSFLYLARLYPRWQCLVYFLALCASIVYDIYIYIYICLLVGGHALCIMDSHGQESNPLVIMGALDLVVWVCAQDNCCRCILCYIVCIIIAV